MVEQVENGDREPLNHMALPYNYYLDMATWMRAVENYIIATEQYFRDVESDYNRTQNRNLLTNNSVKTTREQPQ